MHSADVIIMILSILLFISVLFIAILLKDWPGPYDGELIVDDNGPDKDLWTLNVKRDPEEIPKMKVCKLKVIDNRGKPDDTKRV
jgi:hypothetical protein